MNIAEILKDCPEGTKLWSPICGDCVLERVTTDDKFPINVTVSHSPELVLSFTSEGQYFVDIPGECLLFPSKENPDWSIFSPFAAYEPGDLVYVRTTIGYDWLIIYQEIEGAWVDSFITYDPEDKTFYNLPKKTERNRLCSRSDVQDSRLATEQEKAEFFKALDKMGYTWDAENLKMVKKAHEFKPFDKVLVRDGDDQEWKCNFFSHIGKNEAFQYEAVASAWIQCIPYEGNEHLLGTTNSPDHGL